ncbi:MAG: aminotransferase class III-fold pyridoxal phosphate-dependent enzyme, partial [Acidimicrobiales bacterium]
LEAARRLCDDHGSLLIFDEVISGFGRTGEWFGAQTFGVTPDLITFAKGVTSGYLPLSGVIVSRQVSAVLEQMDGPLRTGYTYSGHPTCAAAGIENMRILETESLVDRAKHIGGQLEPGLAALVDDGLAESYRGVGAIWAVGLGRDAMAARQELLNQGVVVRPIGDSLAVCPPLVITDSELSTIVDAFAEVLTKH